MASWSMQAQPCRFDMSLLRAFCRSGMSAFCRSGHAGAALVMGVVVYVGLLSALKHPHTSANARAGKAMSASTYAAVPEVTSPR